MNAGQQLNPILKDLVSGEVYQVVRLPKTDVTGKIIAPQVPYIVYIPITTTPETSQYGYTGHDWSRVQIDIYHSSYDKCDDLANQVIIAINNHIQPSEMGNRQHLYDNDTKLWRQSFDVEFFTEIPTPTP